MPKKIFFCLTVAGTFMFGHSIIRRLLMDGYDVTLLSNDEEQLRNTANALGAKYIFMPFYRGMNPFKDLVTIKKLCKVLKEEKPDIVMAATPKASMVSMIASRIAGVKIRLYHIYGLPYETASGIRKKVLLAIEKLTGAMATNIVTIATSVKESVIHHNLFDENKIQQPGLLTIGGVDLERFNPERLAYDGRSMRESLSIPEDAVVIGFVARFTVDKGFIDVMEIWNLIKAKYSNVYMLVAGELDQRAPIPEHYLKEFFEDNRVFNLGFRRDIERVFSAMDIFLFPSHREGFGNVSIEASAMHIPVVTYDVTGCKDAVADGISGYVLPFEDYEGLEQRISLLIEDKDLRNKLGDAGRKRVAEHFDIDTVADNLNKVISQL